MNEKKKKERKRLRVKHVDDNELFYTKWRNLIYIKCFIVCFFFKFDFRTKFNFFKKNIMQIKNSNLKFF